MKRIFPGLDKFLLLTVIAIGFSNYLSAQIAKTDLSFVVSMENPQNHLYHVTVTYTHNTKENLDFKMSAWTPGFYEIVDFAGAVANFHAATADGKELTWKKTDANTWEVDSHKANTVSITYDVKAIEKFIGNVYLDENYGYIIPGALLVYLDEALRKPVTLQIKPYSQWNDFVATGLNAVAGEKNTFRATNFDELFDSPLLMGKLQLLPVFNVKNIPHQFIGYDLGDFNRDQFTADLQKIVTSATSLMGDIPYLHYTFLAVGIKGGGGFGGIEHLNSASLLVGTKNLFTNPNSKNSFYSFLAHEFFHLYNVKRIRPIALGPFDYSKENYTNMIWVSEGFTDYYQNLILKSAGLVNKEYVLNGYQNAISSYENSTGHLYQSATQASHDIWAIRGRPTMRTPEEISKTVNVYDKGSALGLLLDLKIRHESQNKHSLDDVMRALYKDYYQVKKRGFTDQEFQQECERMAGVPLTEIFDYASTVKPINYPKYFAYAGLAIDTVNKALPGGSMGAIVGYRDSTVIVREVTWQLPASNAGLQAGDKILTVNGVKITRDFDEMLGKMQNGQELKLSIKRGDQTQELTVKLVTGYKKSFAITMLPHPTALETSIYKSWLRE
ncbi:M61 family metallopeptidase [Pedobacter sp. L105]|uniref:M61 family metallopeptidase n=1 Tax=Pedobacter sp. L105 TaxID=1641871 RepID=UPI00131DA19A|nr:PDZ domain-containing protein [Pedobacter sp. L105]